MPETIRVAQLNVHGLWDRNNLIPKSKKIRQLLTRQRIDILLIQELSVTFRCDIVDGFVTSSKGTLHAAPDYGPYFPGYTMFAPRTEVAILYNSDLAVTEIPDVGFNNHHPNSSRILKTCAIILHSGSKDLAFYSYYRIPSRPRENSADTLFAMELLGDAQVVGGDMNLHHPLWGDAKTDRKASDFLESLGHSNLVLRNGTQQTRTDPRTGNQSAIDLTFASKTLLIENWKVTFHHTPALSDHQWISFKVRTKEVRGSDPNRTTWNLSRPNWSEFRAHQNWKLSYCRPAPLENRCKAAEDCLDNLDHSAAKEWIDLIAVELTESLYQTASVTIGFRQWRTGYARWWSEEIRLARNECHRLHRRKKRVMGRPRWRHKTRDWIEAQPEYIEVFRDWKRARNRRCNLIRRSKRRKAAMLNKEISSGEIGLKKLNRLYNPKKFRSEKIPDFLINNKRITDDADKAEAIHDILINPPQPIYKQKHIDHHAFVERDIEQQLQDHSSSVHEQLSQNANDLERAEIQRYELARVIRDLKTDKAIGPDFIHNEFLKQSSKKFQKVLLRFFNLLFRSRIYPNVWNRANVSPIPKPGKDHADPANYRPIAVSSCIGRLYERILAL